MNFDFSQDQRELQGHVRRVLTDKCPISEARAVADGRQAMATGAWAALAELGCLGTALPEAYGGAGMGYLELCLIAEEVGAANAPVPMASSIYMAAELVRYVGSEAQRAAWLPPLAEGRAIGCVAGPAAAGRAPLRYRDGRLSGETDAVLDGPVATFAVVAVPERLATTLVIVDLASASGVSRMAVASIDPTRPRAVFTFDESPAEVLGAPGQGGDALAQITERAAILLAFEQIGGARRALEMAQEYALTRHAFGRVIGSYQAIKHKLVDIYAKTRLAQAHAYYGAWALSTDAPELSLAASAARVAASEAANFAAQECIQTHGGIGFTWEHPCHLYYRRARAHSLELGPPHEWKARIAALLEDKNAA